MGFFSIIKGSIPIEDVGGIGTPDDLRNHLKGFEDAGVDQVSFIQQSGKNKHEHICESLELFAKKVMPEFKENEINRQKNKMKDLAPYIEKAMKRKKEFKQLQDEEIPKVVALGRQITEQSESQSDSSVFDDKNHAAE